MDGLGEYWWVPVVLAGLGAFLAGYLRRPNGTGQSTIYGSAVVDSSVAREMTVEMRRIAIALEGIHNHLEQTTKDEKASDMANLRAEVRRLKRDEKDE